MRRKELRSDRDITHNHMCLQVCGIIESWSKRSGQISQKVYKSTLAAIVLKAGKRDEPDTESLKLYDDEGIFL